MYILLDDAVSSYILRVCIGKRNERTNTSIVCHALTTFGKMEFLVKQISSQVCHSCTMYSMYDERVRRTYNDIPKRRLCGKWLLQIENVGKIHLQLAMG